LLQNYPKNDNLQMIKWRKWGCFPKNCHEHYYFANEGYNFKRAHLSIQWLWN